MKVNATKAVNLSRPYSGPAVSATAAWTCQLIAQGQGKGDQQTTENRLTPVVLITVL